MHFLPAAITYQSCKRELLRCWMHRALISQKRPCFCASTSVRYQTTRLATSSFGASWEFPARKHSDSTETLIEFLTLRATLSPQLVHFNEAIRQLEPGTEGWCKLLHHGACSSLLRGSFSLAQELWAKIDHNGRTTAGGLSIPIASAIGFRWFIAAHNKPRCRPFFRIYCA